MEDHNLVKNTLDQISQANSNAKRIVGLVKEGGRVTGYQLSDNSIVEKQQAVNMAKQGQIAGVGIAHRGDAEYLKSIPDGSEKTTLVTFPLFYPNPMDNSLTDSIPRNAVGFFFVYSGTVFPEISACTNQINATPSTQLYRLCFRNSSLLSNACPST